MADSTRSSKSMIDLEVISDPKIINMLFDPTRAKMLFTYLSKRPMTINELAELLNKKRDTIEYHLGKLKRAGLVFLDRVEVGEDGNREKYYSASAKDYRLGISGMLKLGGGLASFTRERLKSIITNLRVYGIVIPESNMDEAVDLLKHLVDREAHTSSQMYIFDKPKYVSLAPPMRNQVSQLMRRFMLEEDMQLKELRDQWRDFLALHRKQKRED